jgi:hypothetical protein
MILVLATFTLILLVAHLVGAAGVIASYASGYLSSDPEQKARIQDRTWL